MKKQQKTQDFTQKEIDNILNILEAVIIDVHGEEPSKFIEMVDSCEAYRALRVLKRTL